MERTPGLSRERRSAAAAALAASHRPHFPEQAALAHSGAPLDHGDRPDTGKELVEVLCEGCEFDVAAADRLAGLACLRSNRARLHDR